MLLVFRHGFAPVGMPHSNSPPKCSADTELFKSMEPFPRLTVGTRHLGGGAGLSPGTPCHAGEATHIGRNRFLPIWKVVTSDRALSIQCSPIRIYETFLYPDGHLGFRPVTVLMVRPFLHLMVDLALTGLIVNGNCWTPSRYRDISPLVLVVC